MGHRAPLGDLRLLRLQPGKISRRRLEGLVESGEPPFRQGRNGLRTAAGGGQRQERGDVRLEEQPQRLKIPETAVLVGAGRPSRKMRIPSGFPEPS